MFAHNLFVDARFSMVSDTGRASEYYKPHTREEIARKPGVPQDDKWFNNIFIRRGLDRVKEAAGYVSDYNVYLEGAKKCLFGDAHSVVDPFVTAFERADSPLGVLIRFNMNDAATRVQSPFVDAKLVGVFSTVGQTIEDRYGKAIRVDTDFYGKRRTRPIAGPRAELKPGEKTITWSVNKP